MEARQPPKPRSLQKDAEGQWVRRWTGADWFAPADAWVRKQLATAGIAVTGEPVPYKIRFWAAVWCYPTDRGLYWFKENNPGQSFEASLVDAMARELPQHVIAPLAIEPTRGWLLTADQGATLDEQLTQVDPLLLWRRLVIEYAALQRDTIPAEQALLASGLTRLAPDQLAETIHEIADWFANLSPTHPLALRSEPDPTAPAAAPDAFVPVATPDALAPDTPAPGAFVPGPRPDVVVPGAAPDALASDASGPGAFVSGSGLDVVVSGAGPDALASDASGPGAFVPGSGLDVVVPGAGPDTPTPEAFVPGPRPAAVMPGAAADALAPDASAPGAFVSDSGLDVVVSDAAADALAPDSSAPGAFVSGSGSDVVVPGAAPGAPDAGAPGPEAPGANAVASPRPAGAMPDHRSRAPGSQIDQLHRAADNLAGWGARFSGAIPLALDQNDLHAHNVFAASPIAPFRFFDFGDALWAHPFVTLACVHAALVDPDDPNSWAEDDPRLTEITDAYLHQWTDLAPLDVLHAELEAAPPLHVVHRLVSWHRLLVHADETEAAAWAFSPEHWIAEVIRLFGQD